jgi:hypothetical protein
MNFKDYSFFLPVFLISNLWLRIFPISSLECEPVPNLEPMENLFKLFHELGKGGRGEGEYKGEKSYSSD